MVDHTRSPAGAALVNHAAHWLLAILLLLTTALPATARQRSETEGLILQPVDASMSTSYVMLHRPFVLPDHLTPAFDFDAVTTDPVTEEEARADLERFLGLRNLPADRIAAGLARFDDPAVREIVPAANLRAALLMLTDWDPYQATIDAIFEGKNESGHPYDLVDFRPLDFGSAIATLQIAYSTGAPRLLVSDRYRNELPEQLISVLVHESMHDGIDNSFEEEVIASLLDCLAYAEVLSIDHRAASSGTELAAYNNIQLFALMNSIGRRGAGYVGIETSFDGDVYFGAGLENFDADSIRAGIASDLWYSQLPRNGSKGGAVLAALLGRFPESSALVSLDRFSTEAIEVIDRGIGLVLTPRKTHALAIDLELWLQADAPDTYRPGDFTPSAGRLIDRPFLPADPALFDLRSMRPAPAPFDTEFSRAILRESLVRSALPSQSIAAALAEFDDPVTVELIPDPALRAGLLVLRRDQRWESILASILDGANATGTPVHIAFRNLYNAIPADWDGQGWKGSPVIWVDSMLIGERPELLATAIVEGALLESSIRSAPQTITAAAIASVLWADLITENPTLIESNTWGTIVRNRDLLALLNAQPFDPGTPEALSIGLRLGVSGDDVLPGLPMNPSSFVDYIRQSPRLALTSPPDDGQTPIVLALLLQRVEILQPSNAPTHIDDELLAQIDLHFDRLLPAATAIDAATRLDLTIGSISP